MRFLFIILIVAIVGFKHYELLGHSTKEIIQSFILTFLIMLIFIFIYLKLEDNWNEFVDKIFNYQDAENISWFVPLIFLFGMPFLLMHYILKYNDFIFSFLN